MNNSYDYNNDNNSNDGGLGLAILLALAAILFAAWCCLYPLAALLAAGSWWLTHLLGISIFGSLHGFNHLLVHYLVPTAISISVLWYASRLDHALAQDRGYRLVRHGVRLCLFAAGVLVAHKILQDWDLSWTFQHPELLWSSMFEDPVRICAGVASAIAAHLCLQHWTSLRRSGHEFLESVGLRPKRLDHSSEPHSSAIPGQEPTSQL